MNVIEQNPFRYLGLFANATLKEQMAEMGRVKAFARVGQKVDNPLRLQRLLGPLPDDEETITEKESQIALPFDRECHAMFWFAHGPNPEEDLKAIEMLEKGKSSQAMKIWEKRGDREALQNMMVTELLLNHWKNAMAFAMRVYDKESDIRRFIHEVKEAFRINEKVLLDCSADNLQWTAILNEMIPENIRENIEYHLEKAKQYCNIDTYEALYEASFKLDQLRDILGPDNVTYQALAEQMADALLSPQFAKFLITNPTKWFDRAYEVAVEADTKEKIDKLAVSFYLKDIASLPPEVDRSKIPPLGNYNGPIPLLREYARIKSRVGKIQKRWPIGCGAVGALLFVILFSVLGVGKCSSSNNRHRPPEIKMPEPIKMPDPSQFKNIDIPIIPKISLPPQQKPVTVPKQTESDWRKETNVLTEEQKQEMLKKLSEPDTILPEEQDKPTQPTN